MTCKCSQLIKNLYKSSFLWDFHLPCTNARRHWITYSYSLSRRSKSKLNMGLGMSKILWESQSVPVMFRWASSCAIDPFSSEVANRIISLVLTKIVKEIPGLTQRRKLPIVVCIYAGGYCNGLWSLWNLVWHVKWVICLFNNQVAAIDQEYITQRSYTWR